MIQRLFIALALFAVAGAGMQARDARADIAANPERAGGVYHVYPEGDIATDLVTPKGYEPFYISHYGRHGSRYLINDDDYARPRATLEAAYDAGALTERGKLLKLQLDSIWEEARGRGGELSPLGARQHRGIGSRMGAAYPQAFADGAKVTAFSTTIMRCAHSMFNFIDGLKSVHPQLTVPMESGQRTMCFMNYHTQESAKANSDKGAYYQDYRRHKEAMIQPQHLMQTLFADSAYVATWVDQKALMEQLYWLAVGQQNIESPIRIYDIFTPEELYGLWEYGNFAFFARASTYPRVKGVHVQNARNLLGHIVDNADAYIAANEHGATLRFGHDGNIIPLMGLLRIEGCYADTDVPGDVPAQYADYYVCPMGTNLQFIFFKPGKTALRKDPQAPMLVRVLHNERPAVMPVANAGQEGLYEWTALRTYLKSLL